MGQRNLFFRHFQTKLLKKNYIWNQHSQTCKKVSRAKQNVWILELWMPYLCNLGCNFEKFRVKIKTLKFETKNVLLSIFTIKIWKNDCHIWNQHPRICRNAKNCAKQRKKLILDQNGLILVFWAVSLTKYCHIWNQHPRICINAKFCGKLKILNNRKKNAWFRCF